jgi:hypothetical protein
VQQDEWRVATAGHIHAEAGRVDRTSAIFARRVASEESTEREGDGEGDEWWV